MTLNIISLIIIVISTIAFPVKAMADDTIMSKTIVLSQSIHNNFRDKVYENPSAMFFRNNYSLTSIHFYGVKDNTSEHKIKQMGTGDSFWSLRAKSHYIIDDNNIAWGEASYKKGCREDIKWNETSDFNLLYPYVMADGKGGDMKYEQYYFDGGYAGKYKRWIFGASLRYRALDEYRTLDPRPNNVVADLNAKLGVGYLLGKYSVNLGVYAGKYKQTNELKYFNELGASKEFHLTGLANEFVRFSGACNNVFYKGHNLGTSIELVPTEREGLSFSFNYNKFTFDKILSSLNKLALNNVSENKYVSEVSWTGSIDKKTFYGIKADSKYVERKGYDNLFGDAANNVYPQIGSSLTYKSKIKDSKIAAFFEYTAAKHFPMGISPYLSYFSFESSHAESKNKFKTNNCILGTFLHCGYLNKRNFIRLSLNAAYRNGIKSELSISEDGYCDKDLKECYEHMSKYFAKDEISTNIALRYQMQLKKKDVSLFIETSWLYRSYLKDENDNIITLTTGINL